MNIMTCEVLTDEEKEEVSVGHIKVHSIPQKGEYLWFSKPRRGHTSWIVTYVANWVGDGDIHSPGYHNIAVYAIPTAEAREKNKEEKAE